MLLAVAAGVGFSAAMFFVVRWWESRNIAATFQSAAADRTTAVKGIFDTEVGMLELVRSSLMADGKVERDEFRETLAPFLAHPGSIMAVEWLPRVLDSQRVQCEAAARRDGQSWFQITEVGSNGRIVPAARRDEYFPIYFIGPHRGDPSVFGFDVASEPTRLECLRLACDTGKPVASGRISFVQDRGSTDGFLLCLPVYEKGKVLMIEADRRKNLFGFLLGVFRPDEMLESALAKLEPIGIDVCLYDPSEPANGRPFYFHRSRVRRQPWSSEDQQRLFDPADMHYLSELDVAGHPWTIVCAPTSQFIADRRTWWPWGVLATGLAFTALLGAYIAVSIDRKTCLETKVHAQTADIRRAEEEVIHRLVSASQWRDEETGMHIRRTGLLSEMLAKVAGWSAAEIEMIRQAAPMHDVGKIGIPDAILQKPGRLTPSEFDVMKTHTLIGAEMLAGSKVPMLQMAREIALNHHERWDGHGYPNGFAGQQIPESARIVAIVDVYDALTHDRVYRRAMSEEKALTIMQAGAGTQFDPLLLTFFFLHLSEMRRIGEEYPDDTWGGSCSRSWGGSLAVAPDAGDRQPSAESELSPAELVAGTIDAD